MMGRAVNPKLRPTVRRELISWAGRHTTPSSLSKVPNMPNTEICPITFVASMESRGLGIHVILMGREEGVASLLNATFWGFISRGSHLVGVGWVF